MSTPKRHWFQIHLNTAMVLMISSSALLGMNLVGSRRAYIEFMPSLQSDNIRLSLRNFNRRDIIQYGWPLRTRTELFVVHSSREQNEREGTMIVYDSVNKFELNDLRIRWPNVFAQLVNFENEGKYASPSNIDHGPEHGIIRWDLWVPEQKYFDEWNTNAVLFNCATACAIFAIVACGCEYFIRRREARKP